MPESTDLWLALAKLESYENAKQVLNNAISTIPTDQTIWVSASMLEEAQGNINKVYDLIKRSFKKLNKSGVNISRDQWLDEAIKCEHKDSVQCCRAIIREFLYHGLDKMLEAYTQEEVK